MLTIGSSISFCLDIRLHLGKFMSLSIKDKGKTLCLAM
jgi:hypothetical protein